MKQRKKKSRLSWITDGKDENLICLFIISQKRVLKHDQL